MAPCKTRILLARGLDLFKNLLSSRYLLHLLFSVWFGNWLQAAMVYLTFGGNVLLLEFVLNVLVYTRGFKGLFQVSESSDRFFSPKNTFWELCENGQDFQCLLILFTSSTTSKYNLGGKQISSLQKVQMTQLRQIVQCGHTKVIWTISSETCLCFYKKMVGGGERCKGDGARQRPACKASRPRDAEYSSPGQRFTPIICANLFQTW